MKLLCLLLALASSQIYAGPFTLTCSGSDCTQADVLAVMSLMETEINADLPEADASTYLQGMGNAAASSHKGIGVDHVNDIDLFVLGVGAGIGVDLGDSNFSDLVGGDIDSNQFRGFGVSPTLMAGINMGALDWGGFMEEKWGVDLSRLNIFFNFAPEIETDFTEEKGSSTDADYEKYVVTAKASNFGVHFRYKLIEQNSIIPGRMLYWTGLDFISGIERTNQKIELSGTINKSKTSNGATISTTGANLNVTTESSIWSVPFEVVTGVQWLYALTTYIGAGLDMNFGESKVTTTLNTPFSVSGFSNATLTGALDLGQSDGPSTLTERFFIGQQFNLWMVKLGLQFHFTPLAGRYSFNLGTKFVW